MKTAILDDGKGFSIQGVLSGMALTAYRCRNFKPTTEVVAVGSLRYWGHAYYVVMDGKRYTRTHQAKRDALKFFADLVLDNQAVKA